MSELPPCRGAIIKCNAVGIFSIAFGWRGLLAYVYSGVSNKECIRSEVTLSGGNCSYIVRLSVRDLHGPIVVQFQPQKNENESNKFSAAILGDT